MESFEKRPFGSRSKADRWLPCIPQSKRHCSCRPASERTDDRSNNTAAGNGRKKRTGTAQAGSSSELSSRRKAGTAAGSSKEARSGCIAACCHAGGDQGRQWGILQDPVRATKQGTAHQI